MNCSRRQKQFCGHGVPIEAKPSFQPTVSNFSILIALITAGWINAGAPLESAEASRTGKLKASAASFDSVERDDDSEDTQLNSLDEADRIDSEIDTSQVHEKDRDAPKPRSDQSDSDQFRFETDSALMALQSLETSPIDLATAFAMIGIRNPEFLAAQQRVLEATAARQMAAVQFLPTINLGTSIDSHQGTLQQSDGNILKVQRDSMFIGAGASAIAAGTVNVPGVIWNINVSETCYNFLISRQVQAQREANVVTVNNNVQLRLASAYLELVRAAGRRSICLRAREDNARVAKTTSDFARVGQGRAADADRAAAEMRQRDADVIDAEGMMLRASAKLAAIVGLDTAIRLEPTDHWVVPHSIVPDPIPLPELLAIALLQRPELSERHADIARMLLELDLAKQLPFSPNVLIGLSSGAFGGGSNLASESIGSGVFARGQERFGNFQSRTDFDVVVYWTVRNLGVGNQAQIEASASRARQSQLQQLTVMDQIRAEVASASYRVRARLQQIRTAEAAVQEAEQGWSEDLQRAFANEGLPIEVLNSQRLLFRSRMALLDAIMTYNLAQFELYHALGNPQSELLIRTSNEIPGSDDIPPSPIQGDK